MSHPHAHSRRRARRTAPTVRILVAVGAIVTVTAVAAVAVGHRSGGSQAATPTTSTTTSAPAVPLAVAAVSPTEGASGVSTDATVTVRFTRPLSPSSPVPALTPAVPGTWQQVTPTMLAFVAAGPWAPGSTVTVTVPAGTDGVKGSGGAVLDRPAATHFTVAAGSTLRLQQLLAQLGYLPVSFAQTTPLASPQQAAQPQEGSFTWRWAEPASLVSLWTPGTDNVITRGAVMAFESRHQMKTDGQAGLAVWSALLADAGAGTTTADAYNYVYVSKAVPQKVTVYSNGTPVYSTPANTGVAAAPTTTGTFPVYLRYVTQTMSGTNPDGSKYSDPGIPWVSYFHGGEALHGFVRGSYGWPQSVGCVEMPPENAKVVYPLTPIGTLVTVS